MSKYSKIAYEYRKRIGKCINCGNDAVEGKTRCRKCLDIESKRNREKLERETEEQREIINRSGPRVYEAVELFSQISK